MYTNIKTFEDACKAINIDPVTIAPTGMPEQFVASTTALLKLQIVAAALNEGWQPNWQDSSEGKYEPVFYMNDAKAEARFSSDDCNDWCQLSNVGSRLCFKSAEIAEYAGTQFIDLYRAAFVIQ